MAAGEGLGKFLAEFISSKRTADPNKWTTIRVFLSSTFIDTQGERDILMRSVFPSLNRRLAEHCIRVVGVDLRWGVLDEESKNCKAIQKTCLNQVDACRDVDGETAWFIGLRTHRYGWVQEEYATPEDFSKPEHFQWLEKLNESGNHVSITSLECLHSVLGASVRSMKPKMLIYERKLVNPEDVEPRYRWIFQYENVLDNTHVDESLKLQYNKTPHAERYEDDREALNIFLKSQHGIMTTYREYSCSYAPGNAEITDTKPNGKLCGVGRVGDLEEFAKQVESDLFESIMANLGPAQSVDMTDVEEENLPFQQAMEEKALTFIGRENLLKDCITFCEAKLKDENQNSDEDENEGSTSAKKLNSGVLIIHGEPGCGKSALTAALSYTEYIQHLRREGHFVFTHAVDTCPGSTNLAKMLRRLHRNLKEFRKKNNNKNSNKTGEYTESEHGKESERQRNTSMEEYKEYETESLTDLKENHTKYLELIARENQEKLFVVLIDAVNQFTSHFNSYLMWWIKLVDPPANLRIIISTLNDENSTFANAQAMCPNAHKIPVPDMNEADARTMVTNILKKCNKKLTTTNKNKDLGNQMSLLVSKSTSPLYLTAATEALRTFGIFEKVSEYIQKLPSDIRSLFEQLLKEWEIAYGFKFVKDVCSILCVSRGGTLENTMNRVLLFIEELETFHYDSSFSWFYDVIKGFLAAGGGSKLRLFHDQLKQIIRKKYLSTEGENNRIHRLLSKFYVQEISPQLSENPVILPPAEYEDILSEVAYHQIQSISEDLDDDTLFESTLRNIYFIRERCAVGQCTDLLRDYVSAIQGTKSSDQSKALKSWKKFTHHYIFHYLPQMKCFAMSSFSHYNIVTRQPATSYVNFDTIKLPPPPSRECELICTNLPTTTDSIVTYTEKQCLSCTVSVIGDQKLLLVGGLSYCSLYDLDTGAPLHQVAGCRSTGNSGNSGNTAVHICPATKTFWCGNKMGFKVFSIDTGDELWQVSASLVFGISWFCDVDGKVFVDFGYKGVRAYERGVNFRRVDCWLTEFTMCCIYNPVSEVVTTGHTLGVVKMWQKDGKLLKQFKVQGCVECLRENPRDDFLLAIGRWDVATIYNTVNEEEVLRIPNNNAEYITYDQAGEKLFISNTVMKSVLIYSTDGDLLTTISGNVGWINDICVVPGTGDLVVVGGGGCQLIEVPTTPDLLAEHEGVEKRSYDYVMWCGMLPGGKEFFTLSRFGMLKVSAVDTLQCIRSRKKRQLWYDDGLGVLCALAHPMKQLLFVHKRRSIIVIDAFTLSFDDDHHHHDDYDLVLSYKKSSLIKKKVVVKKVVEFELNVKGVSVSPDGTKCVVSWDNTSKVYNIVCSNVIDKCISSSQVPEEHRIIDSSVKKTGIVHCTDIHKDNVSVLYGTYYGTSGYFIETWDINTGEIIRTLARKAKVIQVRFVYTPIEGIMCQDEEGTHLITLDGSPVWSNECKERFYFLSSEKYYICYGKNLINVCSLENGSVVYRFIDHRTKDFTCLLELPQCLLVYNENGLTYKFTLKMVETFHS